MRGHNSASIIFKLTLYLYLTLLHTKFSYNRKGIVFDPKWRIRALCLQIQGTQMIVMTIKRHTGTMTSKWCFTYKHPKIRQPNLIANWTSSSSSSSMKALHHSFVPRSPHSSQSRLRPTSPSPISSNSAKMVHRMNIVTPNWYIAKYKLNDLRIKPGTQWNVCIFSRFCGPIMWCGVVCDQRRSMIMLYMIWYIHMHTHRHTATCVWCLWWLASACLNAYSYI